MTYEDIKKTNPGFDVPEDIFNEFFPDFKKNYGGHVENHAGRFNCEDWRAFEIAYRSGKIGRNRQKATDKGSKKSTKRGFGSGSKTTDDGSRQARSDSAGDS